MPDNYSGHLKAKMRADKDLYNPRAKTAEFSNRKKQSPSAHPIKHQDYLMRKY